MATSESAVAGAQKNPPPYIAHKTFTNFINGLAQGMPSRIDKSVISNLAGSTQGQLIATLRYFKLIKSDGTPEKLLNELAASEGEDRKKLIHDMVKRSYDFVFSSGLNLQQNATTAQVEELFTQEGLTGETRRKAFSFFLMLCKDAAIKLSAHIKVPKGVSGTRRRTRNNADPAQHDQVVEPLRPASGTAKTIKLKSGGELSLSLTVNLFDLVGDERQFVFDLIDKIQAYGNETKAEGKSEPKGGPQE